MKQLILLSGDILCYVLALWISIAARMWKIPPFKLFQEHLPIFGWIFLLWAVLNYINGIYDLDLLRKKTKYQRFAETALVSFVVSIAFFYLIPNHTLNPKTILLFNVISGYGLSALWRILYQRSIGIRRRLQTSVIMVGCTAEARELIDILRMHPEKAYAVAALIDPNRMVKSTDLPGVDVYHGLHTIRPAITNYHAQLVVIAPHLRQDANAIRELYNLLFWKVQITDLPSFYEVITGRIPPSTFSEGWFLDHLKNREQPIYDKLRTLIDYLTAIGMTIVFVIFFPVIALAIKLNSDGPILIRQKRIGQSGNIFTIYKFRSMYALSPDGSAETEGVEFAVKNDKRVTGIGKFLRKTHLDELPQLWNLFRREITLIGPRPERPEIVKKLEEQMPYYPLRHSIRPGITGWAAIHQNYTDTLETSLQKLQYDLYYIKNRSVLLDLVILLRTINVVMRMMGQ